MNKSSCFSSKFAIRVLLPKHIKYTYVSRFNQKKQEGHRFECYVVSFDEEEYIQCQLKGTKEVVESASKKYVAGSTWALTKISFVEQANSATISGPLKVLINLSKTKAEVLSEEATVTKLVQDLSPSTEVAKVVRLTSRMLFDLVAMISAMETPKDLAIKGESKKVMEITVLDGTKTTTDKMAEIKISVWSDALITFLQNVGCYKPVLLIGLFAKMENGQLKISSGYDARCMAAQSCKKGLALQNISDTVQNVAPADRVKLTAEWSPSERTLDVSGDAALSCCAVLEGGAEKPSAMPDDFVFQVNLVTVEEPLHGQEVLTKDGSRIWFRSQMRDFSSGTNIGITEECALALAKVDSKAAFIEAHDAGELRFPVLCNVRGVRRTRSTQDSKVGASQANVGDSQPDGDAERKYVNLILAKAEDIVYGPAIVPNDSMKALLDMISHCPVDAEAVLPATLKMCSPCPFYGLAVEYANGRARNGKKALVLIQAPKKSKLEIDEHGKSVVTEGILDVNELLEGQPNTKRYTMKAFCAAKSEMDFNIVPVRGQSHKTVLITLTSIKNDEVVIDSMETIDSESVAAATMVMKKMILASQMAGPQGDQDKARRVTWEHPGNQPPLAKKCKTLQGQPTDESLHGEP